MADKFEQKEGSFSIFPMSDDDIRDKEDFYRGKGWDLDRVPTHSGPGRLLDGTDIRIEGRYINGRNGEFFVGRYFVPNGGGGGRGNGGGRGGDNRSRGRDDRGDRGNDRGGSGRDGRGGRGGDDRGSRGQDSRSRDDNRGRDRGYDDTRGGQSARGGYQSNDRNGGGRQPAFDSDLDDDVPF